MKTIIGCFLVGLGVCVGIYVGIYLMFIRGVIQIVQSVTPEVIAAGIAWGVVKIMFAGFVGWLSGVMFALPGFGLIASDK